MLEKGTAMVAVTVDLPTPALADEMAMRFFTLLNLFEFALFANLGLKLILKF